MPTQSDPVLSLFWQCQGFLWSQKSFWIMIKNSSIKNLHLLFDCTWCLGSWWYRVGCQDSHPQAFCLCRPYFFPITRMEAVCRKMRGMLLLCFLLKITYSAVTFPCAVSLPLFISISSPCLQSRKPGCERNCWDPCLVQRILLLRLFSTLMDLPTALPLQWMFPRVCIGSVCSGFITKHHVIHWDNASVLSVCICLAVWAQQAGLKVFSKVQHWAYNDCHRGEPLP